MPSNVLRDDPTCDSFYVSVNLRDRAEVRVHIAASKPATGQGVSPLSGDDYDVYVWGPGGLMAEANNPDQGVETLTFTHDPRWGRGPYEIEVIPFMVLPVSTYKGSAELIY